MELLLDSPGMKEESLMYMEPCVFGEAYINKAYINDSSLDFYEHPFICI